CGPARGTARGAPQQPAPSAGCPARPILGSCWPAPPAASPTGSGPRSGVRYARPAWPRTPAHSPGAG
ncbi:unnamed protein product, partial [Gulo gulo]